MSSAVQPLGVLIVDDDSSFRRVLILRLKSIIKNVTVIHEAGSLREAKLLLGNDEKRSEISLVLLDQHLPDGTGHSLLSEGMLRGLAVLAMSSDDSPQLPAETVGAGATFFISKAKVADALFGPLIIALLERRNIESRLKTAEQKSFQLDTIRTLLSTLQHEINNPLSVVMGAAFILKQHPGLSSKDQEALALVEDSAQRIHHVLSELASAATLEEVTKADQSVFQVPGDPIWGKPK